MGTTSRVDQVPLLHGGTSLADRLENAVNTNQERIMNMIFKDRKENNIVIEVKNGVSSDGSLTGRFYMANMEGWSGEGLTEDDAIRRDNVRVVADVACIVHGSDLEVVDCVRQGVEPE